MVKSPTPIKPQKLLKEFAKMCQKNKTPDGDWQGDGWGIALKVKSVNRLRLRQLADGGWPSKVKSKNWQLYKSLSPIWEEEKKFFQFPKTNMFIVHARSAFSPNQKGVIEFNQPFISKDYCFVFNGTLRGVKLSKKINGKNGAQKIFNLLLHYLEKNNPQNALRKLEQLLLKNSKKVEGLNIGLAHKDNFYCLCQYQIARDDYFKIRYNNNGSLKIVVSTGIGSYNFKKMQKGEIISL